MSTLFNKVVKGLKILLLSCLLGVFSTQLSFAQNAQQNQNTDPPPSPPGFLGYPDVSNTFPVYDVTVYRWVPTYFWYFANYMYLLTYYAWYFYTKDILNSSGTGPYATSVTMMANQTNGSLMSPINWTDTSNVGSPNPNSVNMLVQTVTTPIVSQILTTNSSAAGVMRMLGIQNVPGSDVTGDKNTDNSSFSFDTLFAPAAYSQTQQTQAASFINYITNMYRPATTLTLSTDKNTRNNQLALPDVQGYLNDYRNYLSTLSIAISNLNYLYNERLVNPQANLGSQSGMSTLPTNKNTGIGAQTISQASPLQVQQWMIERRINNPTWFGQMNAASPVDVARETLYVLAEIQAQMYQLHMDNERLLASSIATQMQAAQFVKTQLKTQRDQIQKNLSH